ncbi:MAG TPA: amino acid adenylation domain-containing protein [Herpetosiphonaceae bacterium]
MAIFPTSFAQRRFWLLEAYAPALGLCHVSQAYDISGQIDPAVLQRSLDALVARHEALRTTFHATDDLPVQVLATQSTFPLSEIDLRAESATTVEALALDLAAQEAQRPFDLQCGPLVRACLLRRSDDRALLLLTLHKIIADASSIHILMRELASLYSAFATDQTAHLPELPIQYVDVAVWQHQQMEADRLSNQVEYWQRQLAALPALELPTDRPRSATPTFSGAVQSRVMSARLSPALEDLARAEDATLFMVLLAAFNVLLYRYSQQTDLAIGTPIVNRNRAEIADVLGVFSNTLVMRSDLSGNPSFRQLLHRVRQVAIQGYTHQDLPFERLIELVQPEPDFSRPALFQAMFMLQPPVADLAFAGLTLTPQLVSSQAAQFDLNVSVQPATQGLCVAAEYNTHLFDPATIERMLGHFETLLTAIARQPDQRIGVLPMLPDAEYQRILVDWNRTDADYPRTYCLHQLFEAQAARSPERIAVVCDGQQITYAELDRRSNQLARLLRERGVCPDALVAICMERTIDLIVGLLGILKAGGAYVPLDPAYPAERLAYMLSESQATLLLTQAQLMPALPKHSAQIICVDRDWPMVAQQASDPLVPEALPDNLAYVIYTSGSTGKPKGVQIPHRAVVNFLHAMRQRPGLTEQDTLLSVTTISFDIAGLEIFLPLTVGARTVLVSRSAAADADQLLAALASSQATVMQATPATWRLLLDAGWRGDPTLRILCGGEAIPQDLAQQLRAKAGAVWNMYGPTETTIWSAATPLGAESVLIGEPIANTQLYILDRQMQPVSVGVPGELFIGGDGLARGYRNRPDLTAERFVPNPFATTAPAGSGSRMYRTGDLVRYTSNGLIEFVGRIDHQVKVRGFRIELGEIESVLRQHPAVREAIVLVREAGALGAKQIVAYIVESQEAQEQNNEQPAANPKLDSARFSARCAPQELRRFLQQRLPDYMVPSGFVPLDTLPQTPNGKIDRQRLLALNVPVSEPDRDIIAPRTPTEELLAGQWAALLGREQVSIHDSFTKLGGNSLLGIRLIAWVRETFQLNVPVRTLFDRPTVAKLAAWIDLQRSKAAAAEL